MAFLKPITNRLRRLAGQHPPALTDLAVETWEIAPAQTVWLPPAIFLPDQIARIRATEFADLPATLAACHGDCDAPLTATRGFRLRDVDLVDGVLYHDRAEQHLRPRQHRIPLRPRPTDSLSGALYESWNGNRWFGVWLLDDCLTHTLAAETGMPVATLSPRLDNIPRFESLLGMAPRRIGDAHFDELILFDDLAPNAHKAARAAAMRQRLLGGQTPTPNPGVFLLRGTSGARRVLNNELEIAARLESERGFRVLDPITTPLEDLMLACGGARIVAGVEGSQLCNGLAVMAPGSTLLTIQPPDRMTVALKIYTDRQGLRFAFVVSTGGNGDFTADSDEISRTLDLID